jgi:hypothetical protein
VATGPFEGAPDGLGGSALALAAHGIVDRHLEGVDRMPIDGSACCAARINS